MRQIRLTIDVAFNTDIDPARLIGAEVTALVVTPGEPGMKRHPSVATEIIAVVPTFDEIHRP